MNNEQLLLQIFEDTIKTPHQNKKKKTSFNVSLLSPNYLFWAHSIIKRRTYTTSSTLAEMSWEKIPMKCLGESAIAYWLATYNVSRRASSTVPAAALTFVELRLP